MGLSLKPQHLKRYKDVALLLMKYGRSDLVKAAGLDPDPGRREPGRHGDGSGGVRAGE